jgi:hypothetical protein
MPRDWIVVDIGVQLHPVGDPMCWPHLEKLPHS